MRNPPNKNKNHKQNINMKTKFIVLFLFIVCNSQAQELDSLQWSSFLTELDKIIQKTENEYLSRETVYKQHCRTGFMNLLLNTSIERKGMDYIIQRYGRDSLVLARKFASFVFDEIAHNSTDSLNRRTAINYLLDYSFNPSISQLLLTDFEEEAKQKIVKIIRQQYTKEEINFYATTQAKYDMNKCQDWYDNYYIPNYIKEQKQRYKKKVSYEEVWEHLYQTKILEYRESFVKFPVTNDGMSYLRYIILNAGLLNIQEAIPYLKEYANSEKYDEEIRMYAVCALAAMRVEDYEDRAVAYFDVDDTGYTWIAEMIHSQKVWYAYIRRLKSEKYQGKCPVAYLTIRILGNTLKDFPKYLYDDDGTERWIESDDGTVFLALKAIIAPLVPNECDMSTQVEKTPINPDHIKVVVDWMEANKGKYELQRKVDKTF